ncbi:MAG: twin-arginine translocation signal domain-containing protein [Bacteroidales bacterium]
MKLKRRDFLKTASLLGVGSFTFNPAIHAFTPISGDGPQLIDGAWIPTTCQGCTTWCPVEVYV